MLKECVGNFNSGDRGYQVIIHECYNAEQNVSWEDAQLRMQLALSGSKAPDIKLVDMLDVNVLAEQGMLEDLTPYFAESAYVHQEDFLESITASYAYDGKLIALPRWITIQTLWGKSAVVGDTPGWTVQEMLALAERYPHLPLAGEDGLIPIGYPTLDETPKALLSPVNGLYAIPANASDKEGAWAFLELFFAGELDPEERTGLFYQASGIPVCRRELEKELQRELLKTADMNEEQIATIEKWLEELTAMADVYPSFTNSFLNIIAEEGELYFQGGKTLDETLQVIENRGRLYFQENTDQSRAQ